MIIWLASYPKSGNTWMWFFIKSYFNPPNKKFFKAEMIELGYL